MKKLILLFILFLLLPIIKVKADVVETQIGDTLAWIKGTNYIIENENKIIRLNSDAQVEVTGNADNYRIIISNAINVSIILNNYQATIPNGWNISAIELQGSSNVTLTLVGENNLQVGPEDSVIRVPQNSALTINGNGTLNAHIDNSGSYASSAVIGSDYNMPFGTITINSGNIYTSYSGGGYMTGIGAGYNPRTASSSEVNGTIVLNGGNIHTDFIGSLTNESSVNLQGNGNATLFSENVSLNSDSYNGVFEFR